MASSQTNLIFSFLLTLNFLFFLLPLPSSATISLCSPNAIYQLGDSISDTGNLIRQSTSPKASVFAHLPYGISFLGQPTGRCSNGLLMIDYIAMSLRLPLLNPYLAKDSDFSHGVNFAVAGSTALDSSFLAENDINSPITNSSLSIQLNWLKSHLKSICHTDCEEKLTRSIFFVGEIGGNDYNYGFFRGLKTMDEVQKILVPHVVQSITRTVMEVIKLGATQVIVPGNFPIGCLPIYLTIFQTNDTEAYNEFKCLKGLNGFAMFHNDQLQQALQQLRNAHPNVDIVYADYYNAFKWVLHRAPLLGFDKDSLQKACCGSGGGKYNFERRNLCGVAEATVCPIPETYISWDGIHLTEKAYMHIANWLIRDLTPKLKCLF
ncbi:GDSL esterase/lipase At5g03980-like isoform X2 [Telopea speciosissima]|uniref:GDSL esterase/lipase At5g03980-like isoform X2 n=1 Tax=Telopea speciosissima TaxID=54955 RepID=UPI001CC3AE1B|nr:GDSL esterase/lipase At5g03980-like isoform X2 [Telopea speciosissima]